MQESVEHHAWPPDAPEVQRADLVDLEEFGLMNVERLQRHWLFWPTREGHRQLRAAAQEAGLTETGRPNADWSAVRPVLGAVVAAWEEAGAPPYGIEPGLAAAHLDIDATDLDFARSLEMLKAAKYLGVEEEMGNVVPLSIRPLERALQQVRGWPGTDSEAVYQRFLTAVNSAVEQEGDEVKRSKLERLRDFAVEVGSGTLSELIAKAAAGSL